MPQANVETITTPLPRLPRALPAQTRKLVEKAIEGHQAAIAGLVEFLDLAEGDADDESSGDEEPSLGSQDGMWDHTNQESWSHGNRDDLEDAHDGREHTWTETHGSGGVGCASCDDDEHSLGWGGDMDQERAASNARGFVTYRDGTCVDRASGGEADDSDREPSLAAPEVHLFSPGSLPCQSALDRGVNQTNWARGNNLDLEDEHDGCEPEEGRKPANSERASLNAGSAGGAL